MSAPQAAPAPVFSPDGFNAFTGAHLIVFLTALSLIVGSALLGRRWRGTPKETRLRLGWIWFTIVWQAGITVWWMLPENFDPHVSFPLHLCDMAAWLVPVALWWSARFPRALLYFWGVGLSTQAFFTPVLREGYATVEFWAFWIGHLQIVGSAVYVVAVLGLRPSFRDWIATSLVSAVVLALVVLANQALIPAICGCAASNYWYVGQLETGARTIIDALGPWPLRIVWIVLLGSVATFLSWAPWGLAAAVQRGRDANR